MPGDGQQVLTQLIKFVVVDVILLSNFNNTALFIGVSVPQDSVARDSSRQGCYLFSASKEIRRPKECSAVIFRAKHFKMLLVVGDRGPESRLRLHCSHWAYCTPCFVEVPPVAARCLHVLGDARDPSSERWNFNGRERLAENFA
jgi:hypothetical protein